MSDHVTRILIDFEERFDKLGHDTRIVTLQADDTGESVLRCFDCDETATVVFVNDHGGYYSLETALELRCRS